MPRADLIVVALTLALLSAAPPAAGAAPAAGTVVFDGVRVIDVAAGRVLPGRKIVVVRDGWIAAIGRRSDVAIPPGAQIVAGRGKFLAPGANTFDEEGITREEVTTGRRVRREIVRALHEAGAPLLLGTDSPVSTVIPGLSIHDEMRNYAEAGLPARDILRIATLDAASFLGLEDELGSVEVGKRADLILVRRNPLKRVKNLERLNGVMIDGRWLPQAELQELWEDAVDNYPDVDFTAPAG